MGWLFVAALVFVLAAVQTGLHNWPLVVFYCGFAVCNVAIYMKSKDV